MRIHIGSDHAGLELKAQLIEHLVANGHDVTDHGPYEYDALDDYPDFCIPAAEAVAKDAASLGIVLGGSGNGEQIAANKVKGIRAALVWSIETAKLAREHNNANVISVGQRQHTAQEVKDFIDAGHDAIGIEGSDYSLRNKRAEWATIPDHLTTADITKPFFIVTDGVTGQCDIITAWDVLEHIHENDLGVLIANIRNNLKTGGLFVASVATFEDHPHHVTLKEKDWWINLFKKYKMIDAGEGFFGPQHMVRESSFFLTLKKV